MLIDRLVSFFFVTPLLSFHPIFVVQLSQPGAVGRPLYIAVEQLLLVPFQSHCNHDDDNDNQNNDDDDDNYNDDDDEVKDGNSVQNLPLPDNPALVGAGDEIGSTARNLCLV